MKLGIVLHRDDIAIFEDLIRVEKLTVLKRKGLLCEVESECYPDVKTRLGRSVVMPTSYSMYDKVLF
jgi:hypothetical protein